MTEACEKCGEVHTTIHIYTATDRPRFRWWCPFHEQLCYGTAHLYYDGIRLSFDCGTYVDWGEGGYNRPGKRGWWRALSLRRAMRKAPEQYRRLPPSVVRREGVVFGA